MTPKLNKKIFTQFKHLFVDYSQPATPPLAPLPLRQGFTFEHGDGWYDLVRTLCWCISTHVKYQQEKDPKFYVLVDQVKEKFGGLRFYYHGGDEHIAGMVKMAEALSEKTCEQCGRVKDVTQSGKCWVVTRCPVCLMDHTL